MTPLDNGIRRFKDTPPVCRMLLKNFRAIVLASCFAVVTVRAQPDQRPNIPFIMADDHAVNAMRSHLAAFAHTEHIDRIGRESVQLVEGHTTGVITDMAFDYPDSRDPNRPLLLMTHVKAAHDPWDAPGSFDALFESPPTMLDLAGLPVPASMQGRSRLPLAQNREEATPGGLRCTIGTGNPASGRRCALSRWKDTPGSIDR
jgi:hypothetical protein